MTEEGVAALRELRRQLGRCQADAHSQEVCTQLIALLEKGDESAHPLMSEYYWYLLDQINGVHWRDVPSVSRDAFSLISLLLCRLFPVPEGKTEELYSVLDTALLLGSDFAYSEIQRELDKLDSGHSADIRSNTPTVAKPACIAPELAAVVLQPVHADRVEVPAEDAPSLERVQECMESGTPLVLRGCVDHWPAVHGPRAWSSLNYIKSVAGHRTVPVELGSYLSDDSSQTLMLIRDFIDSYIAGGSSTADRAVGYIAQHRLFHQIPALRRDLVVPDYCALLLPEDEGGEEGGDGSDGERGAASDCSDCSEGGRGSPVRKRRRTEPAVGAVEDVQLQGWLGPAGTVSPLHHDPFHNLLTQVCGYKYVRLYDPLQSDCLYELEGRMNNNSAVDVMSPDLSKYPLFSRARFQEVVLRPGEMLFIPRHHWHWIAAIDAATAARYTEKAAAHRPALDREAAVRADSGEHDISSSECKGYSDIQHGGPQSPGRPSSQNSAAAGLGITGAPSVNAEHGFSFSVNFWWGRRILKKRARGDLSSMAKSSGMVSSSSNSNNS